MNNSYEGFLQRKSISDPADMVRWALRRGRAGLFVDCGLGKGPMQMEWADSNQHSLFDVVGL